MAQILFPREEGPGNKERHSTGDLRGHHPFLVDSVRAEEADNEEVRATRESKIMHRNRVGAMPSFRFL